VLTIGRDTTLPAVVSFLEGKYIVGTPRYDRLFGEHGPDLIKGLGGHDLIYGGYGDDLVRGGALDDALYGGPGSDAVYGDEYDDYLYSAGDATADLVSGGAGSDLCVVGPEDLPYTSGCEALYVR
jgi:Ca2+-binding RTX toxin-like protein